MAWNAPESGMPCACCYGVPFSLAVWQRGIIGSLDESLAFIWVALLFLWVLCSVLSYSGVPQIRAEHISRICGVHSFKKLLPVFICPPPTWAAPRGWEGVCWTRTTSGCHTCPWITRLHICFVHISVNGREMAFPSQCAQLTTAVMFTSSKNVILLSPQLPSEDFAKMWNCSGEAQEWHGCGKNWGSGCGWETGKKRQLMLLFLSPAIQFVSCY